MRGGVNSYEIARRVMLEQLFTECANAGFGRVELQPDGGCLFEAFPGCEDAAADYIEAIVNRDFA